MPTPAADPPTPIRRVRAAPKRLSTTPTTRRAAANDGYAPTRPPRMRTAPRRGPGYAQAPGTYAQPYPSSPPGTSLRPALLGGAAPALWRALHSTARTGLQRPAALPRLRPAHGRARLWAAAGAPRYDDDAADGSYSSREILEAGHGFFGSVSKGLASVVEYAFKQQGRPNGYILGQDAGGAFVAGLRYGEGMLYTKDAGTHRVYWQGPSIGWDAGAEGSKVMMLVYNLRDPEEIYQRFGGVDGSAYLVGGVGMTFQKSGDGHRRPDPIRRGAALRRQHRLPQVHASADLEPVLRRGRAVVRRQ